jgi:hypothetical protein
MAVKEGRFMEAAAQDGDPAPLTGFSEAQRLEAIERWRLLRPLAG